MSALAPDCKTGVESCAKLRAKMVEAAERGDLRILRDPFSAKPNVLFYASKRVGGDVTDFAAIKLLKIAVS